MIDWIVNIIQNFLDIHVALAPVVLIILRITAITIAPIPGTPIDLINIAFFGKLAGFIYAEISILIGASINFWIGRKFREPVLNHFIPLDYIQIWEERLEEKTGFWGLTLVRMITVPIFDYLSYVAGLTKISFPKFFFSSFLASILPVATFYYLGEKFFQEGFYIAAIFIVSIFIVSFLFHHGKIFKRFSEYLKIKRR